MAKFNKKNIAINNQALECPVCFDMMTIPIFQCKSGHSVCFQCTKILMPPLCPICRAEMTQIRNWHLENILSEAKAPCPNKDKGCVFSMKAVDIDDHVKECIFRNMECPLGIVFGKCSWSGQLKEMMDHFKERHPNECSITSDSDVLLNNVSINQDDRFVYLTTMKKFLFIITIKIDTLQKMAYWTVQLLGSAKAAQQWIYEIHITSMQDKRRKVVFTEHCSNDAIKADMVFREAKCALLSFDSLKHFLKDGKLSFRFFIKGTAPPPPKEKFNENKPVDGAKPGNSQKPHFKGPPAHNKKFNKNSA